MSKTWRELPICTLPVGKLQVECALSSPDLRTFLSTHDKNGKPNVSYFDQTEARILICASIDEADYPVRLVRELFHAAFYAAGSTTCEFWLIEERSVRMLTPSIMPTLLALGTRAPPLPDGWESLQAHARYVRRRARKASQ